MTAVYDHGDIVEYIGRAVPGLMAMLGTVIPSADRSDRIACSFPGKMAAGYFDPASLRKISNTSQRLYLHWADTGFSCLGFDVAERQRRGVQEWMGQVVVPVVPGTIDALLRYRLAMAEGAAFAKHTGKRCLIELTPELIGLEGKRVEVTDEHGDARRFWVGKSMGWMPCHLEIENKRHDGGPAAYIGKGDRIRVIA